MSYAIICDARKGMSHGIDTLVLVDRSKTKKSWWTSDNSFLILRYLKKSAADFACKRLRRNNARVVGYAEALEIVNKQESEIMDFEATNEMDMGWDAHKHD